MTPPKRFYPTSWCFHPSEGSTAQLFNHGVRFGPEAHARARTTERPPVAFLRRALGVRPWGAVELSCPVSAASAASAPAAAGRAAPAGRPAARRVPPAGVTAVTPVSSVSPVAAGGRGARRGRPRAPGHPPAAVAAAVRGRGPSSPARALPYGRDDQDRDHHQDDADDHGATLLPFPRDCGERGMPCRVAGQSRVEELQSFGAGCPA